MQGVQGNADQPRSWPLFQSQKKSNMASSARFPSTTDIKEETLLSQDVHDTLMAYEWDDDDEEQYNKEKEAGGPSHEPSTELLDELELWEMSILRCMAKKGIVPTQLREKVRKLGHTMENEARDRDDNQTPHQQSKLKHLRRNLKKCDDRGTSMGGGGCSWLKWM